ncbi:peptidoglycan DD-metalloendopeptidase family protein [Sporosarcina sp. FSL K6-5500]|uniref:peptidoglycan DD-metalloendopeptidase family protein n=1 Tax=Sporosarcina sp. FSL K6-5500 TaxID=2921558 RepID=UPI0030FC7B40
MMFIKPCHGLITSLYSDARLNPVLNVIRPHWGTDYGNTPGQNDIIAAAAGKVRIAVNSGTGFGKYVVITHPNGWETLYAHLTMISVSAGQTVKQGKKIGVKGTTGNSTGIHLHFEMSKGKWTNKYTQHVNPALYINDPDVRHLQLSLNEIGYKVAVDGLYGDGLAKEVLDYQKRNKLGADGVAGRVTIAALEKTVTSKAPSEKEDEELKFSSPALKTETETSLVSKAHRQIIVAAAIKAGAQSFWADRLADNTLTDADVLGLAVKYTVAVNK